MMEQPADIISAAIDEVTARDIELPTFSTLDRLTEQIRARSRPDFMLLASYTENFE